MGRSAAVIVFIAVVAAAAIYCAQRRTVARGDVIAAELAKANPRLAKMECDPKIPIGVQGATFTCAGTFQNGGRATYKFRLDRNGRIEIVGQLGDTEEPPIEKVEDPWVD